MSIIDIFLEALTMDFEALYARLACSGVISIPFSDSSRRNASISLFRLIVVLQGWLSSSVEILVDCLD